MNTGRKTILACVAHPDDEVGCIGTLVNHVEKGDKVVLVVKWLHILTICLFLK
ncbi:MAG: hypothetical protein KAU62_01385 [Candidatus Heimdallarchaeota archaeon]|nr:hypothetical protein [Candidatus Heimdallarchaeota archaeon]MCK4609787.1 hypothetical protein [Candidatus Heimdallarchaeota archaeon]